MTVAIGENGVWIGVPTPPGIQPVWRHVIGPGLPMDFPAKYHAILAGYPQCPSSAVFSCRLSRQESRPSGRIQTHGLPKT